MPDDVAQILNWLRQKSLPAATHLDRIDLREFFEERSWQVQDQQAYNTSSVFASLGLIEFFQRIAHDRDLDVSHAFVYSMARRITGAQGDCGTTLRNCFKAIKRFGIPPARYWPYDQEHFVKEPLDPFLFSFANGYADMHYFQVASRRASAKKTCRAVKSMLAAGFAVAGGFAMPSRLPNDGDVPFWPGMDEIAGGQAVVFVGYDDRRRIGAQTGALLFRSSLGSSWGIDGFGWLPYEYVWQRLAGDFWSVLRQDWIEAGHATRRIRCPDLI
jgi:C1A family cysteine protease